MSGGFRFLNLVKPVMCILPEVNAPDRQIPFKEKILWTSISLFVFLVCALLQMEEGFDRNAGRRPRRFLLRSWVAAKKGTRICAVRCTVPAMDTSDAALSFIRF